MHAVDWKEFKANKKLTAYLDKKDNPEEEEE